MKRRDLLLGAIAAGLLVLALVIGRWPRAKIADWCAGYAPIEGGCLAGRGPLVVYLHGRYDAASWAQERARQTRLAEIAGARGFSVLALRGHEGQCSAPELAAYFCWPSNERNEVDGARYVPEMECAIERAMKKSGARQRFLLGFSSGDYFAVILATRARMRFDKIAVAGAGPVEPTRARGDKVPILLLTADEDASCESMMTLDAELTRERWPHAIVSRDGGHDLTSADVEVALAFFTDRELPSRKPTPRQPPS